MKFISINTGNSTTDEYYKNRFNDYIFLDNQIGYKTDDQLLIVGEYKHIETFNGCISWLITREEMVDNYNLSFYDKVDHFFGTCNENLKERYGNDYVHQDFEPFFGYRTCAPIFLSNEILNNTIVSIFKKIIYLIQGKNEIKIINDLWAGKPLTSITPINNRNNATWNLIKDHILFTILGDHQEIYRTNFFTDFQNKNFYIFLSELIVMLYRNYKIKVVNPNLNLLNVNFQNVHRSGWQYIINGLCTLQPKEPVIIDTYIDKTFGWSQSFYEQNNIIPYNCKWYGFLHHTEIDNCQFYNIQKLISNKQFIKSLPYCEGIIVFSQNLRNQLTNQFSKQGIIFPRIYVCPYPTVMDNIPVFDMAKFIKAKNPYIVQIGTWLRDLFGIYRLDIDPSSKIEKAIIEPINFTPLNGNSTEMKTICTGSEDIVKDISDFLTEKEKEVSILYRLSDEEYDRLLEKNLVFLHLKDASAVNVLTECIVRATPILINPLPAIVEFLGKDYPFYYDSFYEASKKATDIFTIKKAHEYLQNLSLERFKLSVFLQQVNTIIDK